MPRPDSRSVAVLLTALVAFGPLSTDLYLPSLPVLVTVFGTDIGRVQLTLSVFLVGFAFGQLAYGPLSDRFGRRPVLLAGIALYVLAGFACFAAQSIEQLILARFFQAVGACCGPVIGRAVVRDVYGRERAAKVLAYLGAAMTLAPAIGPVIGGQVTAHFGWRANFLVLTVFGLLTLAAVALMLRETNGHRDPHATRPARIAANYLGLFRNRRYLGYVVCAAFTYSGIFAFISGSSFVLMGRLGLTPAQYGLAFGVAVLGYLVGTLAAGRLTIRLGIDRMIRLGSGLAVLCGVTGGALALAGIVTVPAVLVPVFGFMIGTGLILPNAMAGAIGPFPTMAGAASALMGFLQMMVASVVGILVGHLHDDSSLPMMVAIAMVALVSATASRFVSGEQTPYPAS